MIELSEEFRESANSELKNIGLHDAAYVQRIAGDNTKYNITAMTILAQNETGEEYNGDKNSADEMMEWLKDKNFSYFSTEKYINQTKENDNENSMFHISVNGKKVLETNNFFSAVLAKEFIESSNELSQYVEPLQINSVKIDSSIDQDFNEDYYFSAETDKDSRKCSIDDKILQFLQQIDFEPDEDFYEEMDEYIEKAEELMKTKNKNSEYMSLKESVSSSEKRKNAVYSVYDEEECVLETKNINFASIIKTSIGKDASIKVDYRPDFKEDVIKTADLLYKVEDGDIKKYNYWVQNGENWERKFFFEKHTYNIAFSGKEIASTNYLFEVEKIFDAVEELEDLPSMLYIHMTLDDHCIPEYSKETVLWKEKDDQMNELFYGIADIIREKYNSIIQKEPEEKIHNLEEKVEELEKKHRIYVERNRNTEKSDIER